MELEREATKAAARQLLDVFYQIDSTTPPTEKAKSLWQADNKRGFFLGIIQEGDDEHVTRLFSLLDKDFSKQQEFSSKVQLATPGNSRSFIEEMFAFYIMPFHKGYSDSNSSQTPTSVLQTPTSVQSIPSSRSNSVEDLASGLDKRQYTHYSFKKKVKKRDGVCLFCWDEDMVEAAHIIAQKDLPMIYNEPDILQRAGLDHKHNVQNGLLLCNKCHGLFDTLKRYVDVVDDKLVVKVVKEANDISGQTWIVKTDFIEAGRNVWLRRWTDGRQPVEANGEMALYFIQGDESKLPNRDALKFHKAACTIWQMAGGAESDDESCPDDDDDYYAPVDYRSKNIGEWLSSIVSHESVANSQ